MNEPLIQFLFRPTLISLVLLTLLSGCSEQSALPPAPGVALELAEQRAAVLSDVHYDLQLTIPSTPDAPVTGSVAVRFKLTEVNAPLVLDFRAPADHVLAVMLNGLPAVHEVVNDHIVIPEELLTIGEHAVSVEFRSSDVALNRQGTFMYALFVPDRASTAFPVFEQPDIKAKFSLALTIPSGWQALSNGAEISREAIDDARHLVRFAETALLSTYLFSFAAGEFLIETDERSGRTLTMYHRETDQEKLQRNRDTIFELQAASLAWLEEYTGIAYPFDKFAFLAIPAFQFGGMEHPGAIWYRAETLFLDPTASRTEELGRASLIAHESAHMWFGDLVTMRWFNDVWMKEVFANFMAAKIAGPAFPDINLQLRFFQAHHPAAYAVDRTPGANPIRQPLENLRDAGSLYGAIIYQKAPIVMQQLESLVGAEVLQQGLRTYLTRYAYANATWPDLVAILDELTEEDLANWSEVWVNESGRPRIAAQLTDEGVLITQKDDRDDRGLLWNQPIVFAVGTGTEVTEHRIVLQEAESLLPLTLTRRPDFVLLGTDGVGYARFELDAQSRRALLVRVHGLENPLHRAVAWQTLWEDVLDGSLDAFAFVNAAANAVERETNELLAQQVLGLLRNAYWRYLPDATRNTVAPEIERVLWRALERAETPGRKGTYFSTLVSMTLSTEGLMRLERIWNQEETPQGLPLAEQQYIDLAEALALRGLPNAEEILDAQALRISNPDRLAQFEFMRPALSADPVQRQALFLTFMEVHNRRRETWVLSAMAAIHHPLRSAAAVALILPSLNLLEDIQRTGDIFFPLNWLNAALGGHKSVEAAAIVREYLNANQNLPPRLRGKVLQAADGLYRAAVLVQ